MKYFEYQALFVTENGETIEQLTIAFHTYGSLNKEKNNVIWICHALTSNANASEWWPGVVGENCIIDPQKYFIVCANILGSCYGTSGPLSIHPATNKPYYSSFPVVTIKDMVKAHILLRQYLGIENIHLLIGGSMGGYQALEWALMEKERIEQLFLLCTSAAESAWGIAIHTAQRLAIEADATWKEENEQAGKKGLKAARAIGLISYRNYEIMVQKQTDFDIEKTDHFKASSYINYQGEKLISRFNAYSYWLITKAMDAHNLARGRNKSLQEVLGSITQRTLIIAITTDILCPVAEQQFIQDHLPNATLASIDSSYGHDGFLIEAEKITAHLAAWLLKK